MANDQSVGEDQSFFEFWVVVRLFSINVSSSEVDDELSVRRIYFKAFAGGQRLGSVQRDHGIRRRRHVGVDCLRGVTGLSEQLCYAFGGDRVAFRAAQWVGAGDENVHGNIKNCFSIGKD